MTERQIPHNNKNLNFHIRDDAANISLKFHLQMKGKIEFNSHEKNTILVKCFEFANVLGLQIILIFNAQYQDILMNFNHRFLLGKVSFS